MYKNICDTTPYKLHVILLNEFFSPFNKIFKLLSAHVPAQVQNIKWSLKINLYRLQF